MLPLFLSAPTITQILADLETLIRSVTNKVTNTKLTQSLEFHTVLSTMLRQLHQTLMSGPEMWVVL